jgi:glycine/sarcosine/betaine reductase complex component A
VIKAVAEKHGADDVVVLLGCPDADSTEIFGMTVTTGDPTFAGPLAGLALGLPVYHVIEEDVRSATPADVYEAEVGLLAVALDRASIEEALGRVRGN